MTLGEALAAVKEMAADGTIPVIISDPDQLLLNLGAVCGVEGLLDLLRNATSAPRRREGGFVIEAGGSWWA
ncbi:MAG: hypothetical protein ACREJ3_06375 [Polyangiaceae bacterium]